MTIPYPTTLPGPELTGYTLAPNRSCSRAEFESGHDRKRRRYRSVNSTITVEFVFSLAQLQIFKDWYENDLNDGVEWFELNLFNGLGLSPMEARFIDEYDSSLESALHSPVRFTLEVRNRPLLTEEQYNTITS